MPIALAGMARDSAAPTKSRTDSAAYPNSIDQAWTEYRRHRTDSSRDRIITHYMHGHVKRIAERMRAKLPGQVDVDDLAQQGYMGLVDAMMVPFIASASSSRRCCPMNFATEVKPIDPAWLSRLS